MKLEYKYADRQRPRADVVNHPADELSGEVRQFDANVLVKRTEGWAGGKVVLIDRQPRAALTQFAHRLRHHTIALHAEGANTSTTLRYDGGTKNISGTTIGEIMFIPAKHRLDGLADYPSKVRHLLLLIDPKLLEDEDNEAAEHDGLNLPYRQDLKDGAIAGQMRTLRNELDRPGPLSRLFVDSLCCEIAVRALRLCATPTRSRASGGLAPRRVRQVKDYIDENLANDISLSDLAAVAGLSRSHFSRAFRASTGIGAHRFVIRQRVELAKKLLTESAIPIAEVALAAGFSDQSHLTTHFRREAGTTPARFRNLT